MLSQWEAKIDPHPVYLKPVKIPDIKPGTVNYLDEDIHRAKIGCNLSGGIRSANEWNECPNFFRVCFLVRRPPANNSNVHV